MCVLGILVLFLIIMKVLSVVSSYSSLFYPLFSHCLCSSSMFHHPSSYFSTSYSCFASCFLTNIWKISVFLVLFRPMFHPVRMCTLPSWISVNRTPVMPVSVCLTCSVRVTGQAFVFSFKGIFTLSHTHPYTQLRRDEKSSKSLNRGMRSPQHPLSHTSAFSCTSSHADAVTLKTSTHTQTLLECYCFMRQTSHSVLDRIIIVPRQGTIRTTARSWLLLNCPGDEDRAKPR